MPLPREGDELRSGPAGQQLGPATDAQYRQAFLFGPAEQGRFRGIPVRRGAEVVAAGQEQPPDALPPGKGHAGLPRIGQHEPVRRIASQTSEPVKQDRPVTGQRITRLAVVGANDAHGHAYTAGVWHTFPMSAAGQRKNGIFFWTDKGCP